MGKKIFKVGKKIIEVRERKLYTHPIAVITSSNIEEEIVLQTSSQLGVIWEMIKYSPDAAIVRLKSKGLYQQFINALDLKNSEKNYVVNLCFDELDDRVICAKIADFFS